MSRTWFQEAETKVPIKKRQRFPPRHQGPPSKMGPPRSRHIYVTEEEPRAKNLRDGEEDSRFNRNRRDIFYAIQNELSTPRPTTTPSDCRNYNLWCDYYRNYDHTLTQCKELKRILHQMDEEWKLERFLNRKEYGSRGDNERPYRPNHKPPKNE